ncbi:MAG: hypothetical protein ACREXY_13610, partial [Gammaproteobacteria bacterium]
MGFFACNPGGWRVEAIRPTLMTFFGVNLAAGRTFPSAVPRSTLPATASAAAVLVAGMLLVPMFDLGPLSAHMAVHIALMNVAAPLAAIVLTRALFAGSNHVGALWAITAVQLILLWTWNAPPMQHWSMESNGLQGLMHGSLLVAALFYWTLLL